MTRFYSVPFRFLALSNTITSQASLPLHGVKRISEIIPIFPSGSQNSLYYRFFIDATGATGVGQWCGGRNLFEDVITDGELFGENMAYAIPLQKEITESPLYIKMGAQNDLAGDLRAGAIIIVEGQ